MRLEPRTRRAGASWTGALVLPVCFALGLSTASGAQTPDPRVGLGAGWMDAKQAIRNLDLVAHRDRPQGFVNPADMGDFGFANSDLAFGGNYVFQGNYNGFQVWDVSNPASPTLRASLVCPGGQGDLSVYKNLLFMSVEERRGRVDCGTQGVTDTVSAERFRGVRIFDISNIDKPRQIAAVQTCRGSHTHTLVTDPRDPANIYVYVSGTSSARSSAELAGCSGKRPEEDPNSSYFRIEVIRVPLASPQDARIVSQPRIFADSATGAIAGLYKGGDHGPGTQSTAETNMCHDITVYPELGLAAGACSGNGILLDIRDPANPKRIDQVMDPNFAYWHSATFNNDGTKVLYTDEWGGGTQPRCRATDRPEWGADAIFTLSNRKLHLAGYYKLPAPQTVTENCVAHNGSLIPVPGRDIMVQAWYQGGISLVDFTDPAHPKEIAFFDRGPMDANKLVLAGFWSAYWYNGNIYGSEIGRGLDVLTLKPSEYLSQNEIDATKLVTMDRFNPQLQTKLVWPASFVVARAYLDQLLRNDGLRTSWAGPVSRDLARAERLKGRQQRDALTSLATKLDRDAQIAGDSARVRALASVVRDLANR
jgi:LVIVD repeat